MGAWGPGLYSDDIAQDIRDEYKDLLKKGKTDEEALSSIMKNNEYLMNDEDDGPIFWFVLADTLWNLGRLEDYVKEKALFHLKEGKDLKRWKLENPEGARKREKVLGELEEKLNKPQPERKKISKQRIYKCEWKNNDTFAYQLLGDKAKQNGLYGRYLILTKIGEINWYPGHIVPIVRIKITNDSQLPKTLDEINNLQYIQMKEVSRKAYSKLNENNFIYKKNQIFQCIIYTSSKRSIPKSLIYLGNFSKLNLPQNEFTDFKSKHDLNFENWKSLELCMINCYLRFR